MNINLGGFDVSEIKRMDIKEFRESGLLREINRQWLHPRGLALEVLTYEDGEEVLGGIWDYRDDPEGMLYDKKTVASEKAVEGAAYAQELYKSKVSTRFENYGFVIQPVGGQEDAK
jgi:hypothetical protein